MKPLGRLGEGIAISDAFDEQVRAQLHDVAVLDRPRLALVGVHARRAGLARARRPPTCARWGSRRRRSRRARRLQLLDDALRRRRVRRALEAAAPRSPRASRRACRARAPAVVRRMTDGLADLVACHRDRASSQCPRHGTSTAPAGSGAPSRAQSHTGPVQTRGPCRAAGAGTSRTTRPRAPRRGGCPCGRRARPRARA